MQSIIKIYLTNQINKRHMGCHSESARKKMKHISNSLILRIIRNYYLANDAMKKILFLLAIILFSCGCKKDNSTYNSSGLIGEWSWISTCGLAGTDCQTPASTHGSSKLIFTSDSLFYAYQNDTLRISSIFHTYDSDSKVGYIKYDYDSWNTDRFTISHDTLSIANLYGFITWVSRYKSIKQ